MNKNRKHLLITLCLMLVVCVVSVGGTLAWLTASTGDVINTFQPTDIKVELEEKVPADRTAQLIPGKSIRKDPKVSADGDIPFYLFVKVTKENWPESGVTYTIADGWLPLSDGVYYKKIDTVVDGEEVTDASILAGDQVLVSQDLTIADMTAIKTAGEPKLTFKAYVIQQEGFTDAAAAWAEVSK